MTTYTLPPLTGPELDAVLAGLRLLAREIAHGNVRFSDDDGIGQIWTCDGEHDGLPPDEVHALADKVGLLSLVGA